MEKRPQGFTGHQCLHPCALKAAVTNTGKGFRLSHAILFSLRMVKDSFIYDQAILIVENQNLCTC